MLIVLGLAAAAVIVGWLWGRPRALAVTIVVPVIAIMSRIRYENQHGNPPETWTAATLLFTAGFAVCVLVGVGLRRLIGPSHLGRS
jgi:hypothetical protein